MKNDNKKILIVEDDAALLRGVKDNFASAGYSVHTATDGEQGLELALELKPEDLYIQQNYDLFREADDKRNRKKRRRRR